MSADRTSGKTTLSGELAAIMHGSTPNHLHLRERLSVLIGAVLMVDAVASVLAWRLEDDVPRSDIHHFSDAIFWTTTQLFTVSSQMRNPVTGAGMVLDVVIEFIGITVVAALAGSLGSFLYRRSMERNPHPRHGEPTVTDLPQAPPA
ncbi:MAG TPA: ion channel [Kineosporiaceae bacterium]|nr:ion channel [Kineosporiaceae bacterium]